MSTIAEDIVNTDNTSLENVKLAVPNVSAGLLSPVLETKAGLDVAVKEVSLSDFENDFFSLAAENSAFETSLVRSESLSRKLSQIKKHLFANTYDIPCDKRGKLSRAQCLTSLSEPYIVQFLHGKGLEHYMHFRQVPEGSEPFDVVPVFGYDTPVALNCFITNYIASFPNKKEYIFITETPFVMDINQDGQYKNKLQQLKVTDVHQIAFKGYCPVSIDDPSTPDEPVEECYYLIGDAKARSEAGAKKIAILENFQLSTEDRIKLAVYHFREIPNNLKGEFNFMKMDEIQPYLEHLQYFFKGLQKAFNTLGQRSEDFEERLLENQLPLVKRVEEAFLNPKLDFQLPSLKDIQDNLFELLFSVYRATNANPASGRNSGNMNSGGMEMVIFSNFRQGHGQNGFYKKKSNKNYRGLA